ncbi:hypothetical protein OG689_40380 [Kitasatospora sp. NBC_00240]|uniref:scabin-related ADP-ribosyltransferase n=1 Tax=Kitasatospora sp. NBC_00240 TaxID=2903567 RepID=UPI002259FE92|nr:hypothetical protein [Kitasatospora sp. NBC_00240]MCX5215434.1 hypothetical protein [Kitasatospora sp. NBC_00240]
MSLDLPLELRVVAKYVVGVWPSADEDVLRGLAGVYERVVVDAEGLGRALVWQSVGVRGWEGDARQAHDALMERVFRDSGIGAFVDAARSVAGGVRESAAQVEKAKYQVLVIAAWLAASIGWAVAVAPLTGGASLGWLAAVEAFAQELLARVGVWLVRAVAAAGAGALFMMSADGLSQGLVLARGHGGRFDVGELFMSGGMGALAGLVGLGVGAVAARGEVAVRGALVGAGRSAPVGGEVLFAPVWTGSLPARMGLQGLSGVVTGVGLGAVQGAPVTDAPEAFAQGVVGALAGRHGGVRAGKVPEGLAALVARLPGADGGGRFEPSEAVPDWVEPLGTTTPFGELGAERRRGDDDASGHPSMDSIRHTLGKLPESYYLQLLSQMDGFAPAPILLGTDPATRRERAVQEEKQQRIAHALHQKGPEHARALAEHLGVASRPGLPGGQGLDHQYVQRDDDDLLYRADARDPDLIFEEGFQPRNPAGTHALMDHISFSASTPSQWVSTSRWQGLRHVTGHDYEIDAPGKGIDAALTYGDDYPFYINHEKEVAFEGGIDRSLILGASEEVRLRRGMPVPDREGEDDGFYLVNPNFGFNSLSGESVTGPTTDAGHGSGRESDAEG